jgi:hypothetical protein
VLKGFNDLATKYPEIAKEWDYSKNRKTPDQVAAKSSKKYWWKCPKCGHGWRTEAYVRTGMGCSCPECKKRNLSIKASRKVINLDTGIIYKSMKDAEKQTGIGWSSISNCVRGLSRTAGGYRWSYAE